MKPAYVNTRVLTDPGWWHWAATVPLLAAHLLGSPRAGEAALALCIAMSLYFLPGARGLRPFAVQVRLAFAVLLLLGLLPAMGWIYVAALAGTVARVLVGYCLLARVLQLVWFNRSEPLTSALLRRVFLAPPDGGLFRWRAAQAAGPPLSCSCDLVPLQSSGQSRGCGARWPSR